MSLRFRQLREQNLSLSRHVEAIRGSAWGHDEWLLALGASAGNALDIVKKLNNEKCEPRPPEHLITALGKRLGGAVIYLDMCIGIDDPQADKLLGANRLGWDDAFDTFRLRGRKSRPQGETATRLANRLLACVGDKLYGPGGIGWANDVLGSTDRLAEHFGIDLGAAVAAKFNAASERHGFPERLVA